MERAVLDQLADYFNTRLAAYPTTLAEDESMVLFIWIRNWTLIYQLFTDNLCIILVDRWQFESKEASCYSTC